MKDSLYSFMSWKTPGIVSGRLEEGRALFNPKPTPAPRPSDNRSDFEVARGVPRPTYEPTPKPTPPPVARPTSTASPIARAAPTPAPVDTAAEDARIAGLVTNAKERSAAISADPQGVFDTSAREARNAESQLDILVPQLADNPGLQTEIDNLIKLLKESEATQAQAQKALRPGLKRGQNNFASSAITNPSSLIQQGETATTAVNPNQLIDNAAGQAPEVGLASTATAGSASQVANQTVTPTNTATTATTGAAAKGILEGLDTVQGSVSSGSLVSAEQGALNASSLAKAIGVDKKYIQEIQAGTRQVSPQELATAAKALDIPQSEAQSMFGGYQDIGSASFDGTTPTATAQDGFTLSPTQVALQAATTVQSAATVSAYPTAEAAQSSYESTLKAAQGKVGSNELIDANDIVGAETAITAVAATMSSLDDMAVAMAAQGSFSQSALAVAAQGTVPPSATVQGQMSKLMQEFNNGTPVWAAGAMRAANAAMNARGLGASSMASGAIVQATMEAAVPIAAQDAQFFAAMNLTNTNNRQQVSLANAAAQQNMELSNLSNEQQSALQNSSNAFSLQSQNLSNTQAAVLASAQFKAALQNKRIDVKTQTSLANASRFAEMNQLNLSNRQQANIQRSSESLQVNMANLSNEQQTALSNLQVRASLVGQELSNEQQVSILQSTQDFNRAQFDASSKTAAFMQDAQVRASMEGKAMDIRQQTQLFNVGSQLEERKIELSNEQQTLLFNGTSRNTLDLTELSNRQQTSIANAQIDAALRGQELSNNQQTAIFNASKFSDAANLTFTADQTAQLSNSQMLQTIGLAELSANQGIVLQNAANSANMDMANLSIRDKASVLNAQSFLAMDMKNLDLEQQTSLFKTQQNMQSLFTDTAATNAAAQFNATSENQTDQFFAGLSSRASEFNVAQSNAIKQFNAGETNAIEKFNTTLEAQRDQFNTQNALVISQSNAVWRQQVATAGTAAQNISNLNYAKNVNAITGAALDQVWQRERDLMDYAFNASENTADRSTEIILAKISGDSNTDAIKLRNDLASKSNTGKFLADIATSFLF